MIQEPEPTSTPSQRSVIEIWVNALTQPSEKTFYAIATDENATNNRAYLWIFISGIISGFINYLSLGATGGLGGGAGGNLAFFLLCGLPLGGALSILGAVIVTGISQGIAGLLGGKGNYSQLLTALSAYAAPLGILSSLIGIIPFVNLLVLPLGLYGLVLNVIAIKAVNQFDWGRAIVSSAVVLVGLIVCVAVFVIVILALLGPAIGNVFSNIVMEI